MGAIGGLFGLDGGASGTGFDAPQQAGLESQQGMPLGIAAGESYYRNQAALDSQNRLLSALNEQRALQKQTDVYGQLQDIAAGKGPNPAQAMLNQATGANVANQASLMAGQRGSGANVGLMARQIAGQGANIQQQAAGQGAVMQANQSMGAIDRAGNLANTMAANQIAGQNAVTNAEQAQYGNLLNALAQQNQARIGSQSSVNTANATLAANAQRGQQGIFGGMMNAMGQGASSLFSGNKAAPGYEGTANPVGSSSFSPYAPGSTAPGPYAPNAAHGGMIKGYDNGGVVSGPQSSFGKFISTVKAPEITTAPPQEIEIAPDQGSGGAGLGGLLGLAGGLYGAGKGIGSVASSISKTSENESIGPGSGDVSSGGAGFGAGPQAPDNSGGASSGYVNPSRLPPGFDPNSFAGGGLVDVVLSPGEKVVPPGKVNAAAGGKVEAKTVPGKAQVPGDSVKNDTYQTKLPEGSVVVPRTKSGDNKDAAEFVRKVLAQRGRGK